MRPGFLELRETSPGTYSVLWKHPTGGEVQISIAPVFPEGCSFGSPDRQQMTPGAVIVRGTLRCEGGLGGKTIRITSYNVCYTKLLRQLGGADRVRPGGVPHVHRVAHRRQLAGRRA